MCAIIGWSGKLPKGLLSRLFAESESRGKDSTGLAFRVSGRNLSYRQAVPAKLFVNENSKNIGDARRSLRGIGHTRRASPGMPIDNNNAHPYAFWKYFYAHNGRIANWQEIKEVLVNHYKSEYERLKDTADTEGAKAAKYYWHYANSCTTDSMVLGPYIDARDFSSVMGCMGLVWLKGENVYTFRYAKEAIAANLIWKYKEKVDNEEPQDQFLTIVASTKKIIEDALAKTEKVGFDVKFTEFAEDRIFRVEPQGLVDEGTAPVNQAIEDTFSSETVGETDTAAGTTATTPNEPAVTPSGS